MLPFVTMSAPKDREKTPFGKRLHEAAEAEGTSVTRLGREHGFGPGLHRYVYSGPTGRGEQTLESIARLLEIAKKLHVNFEWLITGEGPMRRGGRGSTPAEEAIVFARRAGSREDAIQQTWDENRDKEHTWDAWQWAQAIDATARRLERAGVPRPEEVAKQRAEIAREKKRLSKKRQAAGEIVKDASAEPHTGKRAVSGSR